MPEVSAPVVRQTDDGPNDFDLGTVEVYWNEISGDFSISDYTIKLFVNDALRSCISVSPDILSTRFSAPHDSIVQAKITVNSACGQSITSVKTNEITVVYRSTSK